MLNNQPVAETRQEPDNWVPAVFLVKSWRLQFCWLNVSFSEDKRATQRYIAFCVALSVASADYTRQIFLQYFIASGTLMKNA